MTPADDEPSTPTGTDGDSADGMTRRRAREAVLAGTGDDDIWVQEPDPTTSAAGGDTSTEPTSPAGAAPPRAGVKSSTRNLIEWGGVIIGAVLIAVVVRTFVFQTFWIPSPSMSPTLVENDRVLVNKLSYEFHDVNRGDVVVFERPPNEPANEVKDLIKRVVGLSGERVSIVDGSVRIDGKVLDEPYTHGLESVYNPGCGTGDVTGIDTDAGLLIPEGHVFVMGDNRVNSADGRCFGPIDEDLIVGRAFFILWPPSKMGGL